VYANNTPPKDARVMSDLLEDISLRFSVPVKNIHVMTEDGTLLADPTLPIEKAPPKMLIRIHQANGGNTTYETELEFADM
jgi:hypothetical protein